jgi:predicted transposase YdaD
MDNDILKTFLETHSSEVFNMLLTEWNTEEAKVVWHEEGFEEGLEKGREEVAQNALAKGIPLELIHDITGLNEEALKHIQARL